MVMRHCSSIISVEPGTATAAKPAWCFGYAGFADDNLVAGRPRALRHSLIADNGNPTDCSLSLIGFGNSPRLTRR